MGESDLQSVCFFKKSYEICGSFMVTVIKEDSGLQASYYYFLRSIGFVTTCQNLCFNHLDHLLECPVTLHMFMQSCLAYNFYVSDNPTSTTRRINTQHILPNDVLTAFV